jgi:hypothetical protein
VSQSGDKPSPDADAARARIEQLVADNTEKDIARRQAEQRAEDLAAAQAEAETKRDEMAADLAHEIELRAGAETALEAEKVEHALTREQDAARYGDLDTRYQQKVEEYLDQVQLSETFLGERDVATAEVSRLMTTLLAMKESAEEATRQHQEEVSKYATEREALTQELNAAARLKVEAVNAQHDAEAAREAAIQRAEAAECDKGTAEQAHQAAAVLLEEQRQQERTRLIGVIAAHRALIADVMSRMVERETEKARRHQATPEKLRKWADGFYSLHEQTCVEALTPALRAHLAWLQSAEEPEAVARGIVRTHIRESLTQLRAVADADPDEYHGLFERTLTRWETERPAALADAVQKEAISHVAGL